LRRQEQRCSRQADDKLREFVPADADVDNHFNFERPAVVLLVTGSKGLGLIRKAAVEDYLLCNEALLCIEITSNL